MMFLQNVKEKKTQIFLLKLSIQSFLLVANFITKNTDFNRILLSFLPNLSFVPVYE